MTESIGLLEQLPADPEEGLTAVQPGQGVIIALVLDAAALGHRRLVVVGAQGHDGFRQLVQLPDAGAGKFRQLIHVTLPGIAPIIFVMAVLSLGNILNAGMDQVMNMYSPQVYMSGDILDTYIYRIGLEQAQYSLSTAAALFKSVVSAGLMALAYSMAIKYGDYQLF